MQAVRCHGPHELKVEDIEGPEKAPGAGEVLVRIERGGISGYVFLDDNGNGIRDAGEPGIPGVRVVVGGRAVRTDARGRHSSWDLVPFEPVEIWTDSTSIPDPTLVPVRNQISVMGRLL